MYDINEILEKMKQVATESGKELLKFDKSVEDDFTGNDFPTAKADKFMHNYIKQHLLELYPDIAVLSEEDLTDRAYLTSEWVFVVDPIDGTKDYLEDTGDYAIMIALLKNKSIVASTIYSPHYDTLYYAKKGGGAKKLENGEEKVLKVNQQKDPKGMLVSRFHATPLIQSISEKLGTENIPSGSAGLKMCKIAEGIANIYIIEVPKAGEWDSAAGELILKEAGGKVTDLRGNDLTYCKEAPRNLVGLLATDGKLHEQAIELTKSIFDHLDGLGK